MEVAKKKGLPLLKHHLLPRVKGFFLVASQLKNKVDYLYDINLAVKDRNGRVPNLMDIKNGIPVVGQMYIRRIPMSQVPVDDEKKCAEFLFKLYKEKVNIFFCFLFYKIFFSISSLKIEYKNYLYKYALIMYQ